MSYQAYPIFKAPVIWSTALILALSSTSYVQADNTYFSDDVNIEESKASTPVEIKAAEFKKVLQEIAVESSMKSTPSVTTDPTTTSESETPSLTYDAKENTSLDPSTEFTLAESVQTEPKAIIQPLVSEIPFPENTQAETEEAVKVEEIAAKENIPLPETKPTEAAKATPEAEIIAFEESQIQVEKKPLPILEAKAPEDTSEPIVLAPTIEVVEYTTAQNGRSPLGIVESNRDLGTQKWYLFSSARRGIKSPNDTVEIVSIINDHKPSNRGEEVKALLIEMGIKPENIKLVVAKGEENQVGKIYIFGK